ncbi:MAG: AAA family ATPase [Candidatus Micrarchaeia archaeon]
MKIQKRKLHSSRRKIIAIMGTPGVGKSTFAKKLSKKLGLELIEVNKIVDEYRLYSGKDKFGTKVVKLKELEKLLNKIAEEKGSAIFEGHLLADLKLRGAIAIVLREHLPTLYKRLEERGYPYEKIIENLESEATDYSGLTAERNYKEVYEFLSSDKSLMKKVKNLLKNRRSKKESIELLEELIPFIKRSSL